MGIRIRPITPMDVTQVVQGWNAVLKYDPIDEQRFTYVVLEDPNYEPEGTPVALDGENVVGLLAAVAREGIAGRDGRGRPEEADLGYIRGLYALPRYPTRSILDPLLRSVEDYLRAKGKRRVRVVQYTGRYFFPGLDSRYEDLLGFLEHAGFERTVTLDDMDADLTGFTPNAYQQDAIRRAKAHGVAVVDYTPEMRDALAAFVQKIQIPHWFSEGWEDAYEHMVVAVKGDEIIGWVNYSPCEGYGSFGPVAVLPEHRGMGLAPG